MKVAYNACFGGFQLRSLALTELAKLKGVDLELVKHNTLGGGYFIDKASGKVFNEPDDRADPDLISIVELMGDMASARWSYIRIREIPDGAEYEITSHGGLESVELRV